MQRWFIVDQEGNPMQESELPERPKEANPTQGDAFRPWFKQEEHLHIENGKIAGMHGFGTLESVQERLVYYRNHESSLLTRFVTQEDILLSEADLFLRKF